MNWLIVVAIVLLIIVLGLATRTAIKKGKSPTSGDSPGPGSGFVPSHPERSNCPLENLSDPAKFSFPAPVNFTIHERISDRDLPQLGSKGRFSGEIKIERADAGQEEDVRVWVSIATTPSLKTDKVRALVDDHSIELLAPSLIGDGLQRPCMDIFISVRIREGVELAALKIMTWNFNVNDARGSDEPWRDSRANSANSTYISTRSGRVDAYFLNSRETAIKTSSGQVEGMFGFQDVLYFESNSGKVLVDVLPIETSNADSGPAAFIALTDSGDIHAGVVGLDSVFSEAALPTRDYRVRVETYSGKVSGQYVFTSAARFKTLSGAIVVDLLPYSTEEAALRTETKSGATEVNVRSPYGRGIWGFDDKRVLDRLHSSHVSESGKLALKYPAEWIGLADLQSRTGDLAVYGHDVYTIVDEDLPGYYKLVVRKGSSGQVNLNARTSSGAIRLDFP